VRRSGKGTTPSKGEPFDETAVVFLGTIGTPEDADDLSVEISRSGEEIILRSEATELGRWSLEDVTIKRTDETSFAFTAEEDRLVFRPEDPDFFGSSPLVTPEVIEGGRRKFRKTAKSTETRPTDVVVPEVSATEEVEGRRRKRRKAAKSTEAPPEGNDEPRATSRSARRGPWIWLLDTARRRDLFGLDRVPIDERLRGGEHQHTWDDRVATGSGLASHVCTMCGKIRL